MSTRRRAIQSTRLLWPARHPLGGTSLHFFRSVLGRIAGAMIGSIPSRNPRTREPAGTVLAGLDTNPEARRFGKKVLVGVRGAHLPSGCRACAAEAPRRLPDGAGPGPGRVGGSHRLGRLLWIKGSLRRDVRVGARHWAAWLREHGAERSHGHLTPPPHAGQGRYLVPRVVPDRGPRTGGNGLGRHGANGGEAMEGVRAAPVAWSWWNRRP